MRKSMRKIELVGSLIAAVVMSALPAQAERRTGDFLAV
jgi:hypothetical protein